MIGQKTLTTKTMLLAMFLFTPYSLFDTAFSQSSKSSSHCACACPCGASGCSKHPARQGKRSGRRRLVCRSICSRRRKKKRTDKDKKQS